MSNHITCVIESLVALCDCAFFFRAAARPAGTAALRLGFLSTIGQDA